VQVFVRDNNVDQALRALKKKMQREGIFREMKLRGRQAQGCVAWKPANDSRRHPIFAKFVTPTFSGCGEFFRSKISERNYKDLRRTRGQDRGT